MLDAGGNPVDGTYSLIQNPADNPDNERTIYQSISGKYLYYLYLGPNYVPSSAWFVGDDYKSNYAYQNTESTAACPADIADWSLTCALPTFMGYPNYKTAPVRRFPCRALPTA